MLRQFLFVSMSVGYENTAAGRAALAEFLQAFPDTSQITGVVAISPTAREYSGPISLMAAGGGTFAVFLGEFSNLNIAYLCRDLAGSGGFDEIAISHSMTNELRSLPQQPFSTIYGALANESGQELARFANVGGNIQITAPHPWASGGVDRILFNSSATLVLEATNGRDFMAGMNGRERLSGRGGDDYIEGRRGNDVLSGGYGNDFIYGGSGRDRIYGGTGVDQIFGGTGDDTVEGGTEADTIYGGDGADWLFGDAGDDFLYGGAGDDRLSGGSGYNVLTGGEGADQFVIQSGSGVSRIDDFSLGQGDKILIGSDLLAGTSVEDDLRSMTTAGPSGITIALSATTRVEILGSFTVSQILAQIEII